MILRGSTTNVEKGHEPTARVGVNPGAIWETISGIKPKPTAKALSTLIPKMCIPHCQMDNLIGEWVSMNPGMNAQLQRGKTHL